MNRAIRVNGERSEGLVVRGETAQHAPPGKIAVARFFGLGNAGKQQGGTVGIGRQQAFGGIEHGDAAFGFFIGASVKYFG